MKVFGAVALMLAGIVAVVLLWRWLDLIPPEEARIAAGVPGSGYHAIAERYRDILDENGIALEIVETAGSVENAALLSAGEVDLALVQGGIALPPANEDGARLEAVAALLLEPLLIFARHDRGVGSFPPDWRALEIAIGAEGSGTRRAWQHLSVAMALPGTAVRDVPLSGQAAADALRRGELDAAVFVAPLDAPYLADLFEDDSLRLVGLENARGLARAMPAFVLAELPAGTIDYAGRVPATSVDLLSAPLRLVGTQELHPAVTNRLVRAAQRLHGPPSILHFEGQFPTAQGAGLAMNPAAAALLETPPSGLETFLPYWIAAQINRFALLLVPVLFILLPLIRAVPGVYDWTLRMKIYRQYAELREIDVEASRTTDPAKLAALTTRLDGVDEALRTLNIPVRYRENAYLARSHVDLIRDRIAGRLDSAG